MPFSVTITSAHIFVGCREIQINLLFSENKIVFLIFLIHKLNRIFQLLKVESITITRGTFSPISNLTKLKNWSGWSNFPTISHNSAISSKGNTRLVILGEGGLTVRDWLKLYRILRTCLSCAL